MRILLRSTFVVFGAFLLVGLRVLLVITAGSIGTEKGISECLYVVLCHIWALVEAADKLTQTCGEITVEASRSPSCS
jgi:hypothetical protein